MFYRKKRWVLCPLYSSTPHSTEINPLTRVTDLKVAMDASPPLEDFPSTN